MLKGDLAGRDLLSVLLNPDVGGGVLSRGDGRGLREPFLAVLEKGLLGVVSRGR